ncbi:Methylenetetrahydrofolate reductase 2 [Hondaea fermentalgiana]|uniref:Methylenetetrahydrofolate reductase 2 n=1 Tax=Hondaea fermentalgiana TaxID=2315210 RepID=A0A2R5GKV8_9STRA|nr:Methylenetetrahydrofolate reductase 2 [Hondaea fermentalgiana]|eukprot:GBG31517.1 Methylenetetrahydrofolate reductase 2 [Hondaea fermentalgiana]
MPVIGAELTDFARALAESGVTEVLALAGDGPERSPACYDASHVLETLLDEPGAQGALECIGVAAYPTGHAIAEDSQLWQALERKADLLSTRKPASQIFVATQLGLSTSALVDWHENLRVKVPFLANAELCVGVFGLVPASRTRTLARRLGFGKGLVGLMDSLPSDSLMSRASAEMLRSAALPEAVSLHISTFDTRVLAADTFWAERLQDYAQHGRD